MADDALTRPLRPQEGGPPEDPLLAYWLAGGRVMCREGGGTPVAGADPANFEFFAGGFGRDGRHAWFLSSRLRGADGARFRALNFAWFSDGAGVWCVGGRVKDADGASFEACDAGVAWINGLPFPHSYGRDRERVFFYDFQGKASWVRKADPASFESLGDGAFGLDARHVFRGHAVLARADRGSWRKLGGYYSRDARRIFYDNRAIADADPESFRVVASRHGDTQLARDARTRWWNDQPVSDAYAEELWRREALD